MLTRLEIDGFKTFENFEVDFLPFTVVLGNNAAGKSNLFDAIRLLSLLAAHDVAEAVKVMRGEPLEIFRKTPSGVSKKIKLAAEVLVDPIVRDPWGTEVSVKHTRMRYEVILEWREVRKGIGKIQVSYESAKPILKKNDRWLKASESNKCFRRAYLRYVRQTPWLTTEERPDGPVFNIHQDGKQGRNRPASAAEATVIYSITHAEFPSLFALKEEMRRWRMLQLDPALLRRPASVTASDDLDEDGANLAAVLARIKAETVTEDRPFGVLSDIASELNHLINGVSSLDADLHEDSREYRVVMKMRDGLQFSSRVISDGTLRILALLTLLNDPRRRGMVCFEEPENGVHPGRIKEFVRQLRDVIVDPQEYEDADGRPPLSQLILNSHSPVVLSALLGFKGGVFFADTSVVVDPETGEKRRKTRLRPIAPNPQYHFSDFPPGSKSIVPQAEVDRVLDAVSAEG